MLKRITACLLLLLTVTALLMPAAYAAEPVDDDYEGELDIETNKPITWDTGEDQERVTIVSGVIYDRNERLFFYQVGTAEVGISQPDGVVTTQKIKMKIPDGMPVHVWRNGEELKTDPAEGYSTPGSYKVQLGASETESASLTFTIIGELTGAVTEYRLPTGFELTSLTVNAQQRETRTNVVDMTDEGKYEIEYRCVRTGVSYALNCTVDHTPPVLKLEAVKNGYAAGPVDISDLEKGAAITIKLNGDNISYSSTLKRSGTYDIILQDKAGNRTTYNFVIRVYFNFNAWAFFGIMIILIILLVVYVVHSRRNLRVR